MKMRDVTLGFTQLKILKALTIIKVISCSRNAEFYPTIREQRLRSTKLQHLHNLFEALRLIEVQRLKKLRQRSETDRD